MNKIIFSAFFALYCFCLQAQQISVEFSIEWKKDLDFQITGGTFTFQFDDTKSLDYVEIEPVREERNVNATVQYSTQKLPEKVG
ncbi:MAG: hypothetical protein LBR64_05475, partial [Dysgonamonadaceae bacterium]|nr:hypothetical protein [Dysgonamonadaceae bacterium]